jgi:hypothetical protein
VVPIVVFAVVMHDRDCGDGCSGCCHGSGDCNLVMVAVITLLVESLCDIGGARKSTSVYVHSKFQRGCILQYRISRGLTV